MYKKVWKHLRKIDDTFELEPETVKKTQCFVRVNFVHIAFDCNEEHFVATDTAGYLYYIDLTNNYPSYQKLGNVGRTTFIAFNPINNFEIIIGLTTSDIKILRVNINISQYCLLIAHKLPPIHISFFKQYCLTSSDKEVIIWCLRSCTKAQQLKINTKNIILKKASFSNLGHVVVLYNNDTLQAWNFNQLENDTKIDTKVYGIRNIKDFLFTQNGRAMIIASAQNKIVILNTCNWNLMKTLNLPENFISVKHLSLVPQPLDGGANNIVACLSPSCTLFFFDLNRSCTFETLHLIKPIKKIVISPFGRYIAYIEKEGHLKLVVTEKLFSEKCGSPQKLKEPCRPISHRIHDHLSYVQENIKQELHLDRLMLILKEFGEYPENYRLLIWSTILKLPANRNAYNNLANKTVNSNFATKLLKNYPLADRNKKILLTTTINCLIQWCPLLVQCSFLPNLVFPFVMVFQKNLLLSFELILSVFLNFCQKWFEYHPLPPLNILGVIENILLYTNPSLLNIFCERGITSSEYAWPLLKTAMSEVLSGSEWIILWDHLISFKKPSLLLMTVVAYSICSHEIILSSLQTQESVKRYFTSQGHIGAKELIKVAQQLDNDIPLRIHPSYYLKNEINTLSSKGPYQPFMIHDFPKFLTDDLSVAELEKLKEKEQIFQKCSCKELKFAEENRLKHETKVFMDQIHRARLREAQKCNREQLLNIDWRSMRKQAMDSCLCNCSQNILHLDLCTPDNQGITYSTDAKTEHYHQLQQNVDKLEYEVQSLLDSLRSQKTKVSAPTCT